MKIVFICPNWAGLATPIVKEMRKQGHQVIHLDHSDLSCFHYFDSAHRVLSKLYNCFSHNSYKHEQVDLQIEHALKSFFIGRDQFDVVIMTEPNIFNRRHLTIIKEHCRSVVATLWDSLIKSPDNGKNLDLFDSVFSYDQIDCDNHGLTKINNYLDPAWSPKCHNSDCEYDIFSIMSFTKERYKKIIKILNANPTLKMNILFFCDHPRKENRVNDDRVKMTNQLILNEELANCISRSRAILDVLQGEQSGLSFRVYESIGYKRKLVTTNTNIKNYDIYNENNIKVIDESNIIEPSFFDSNYQELSPEVIEKYTINQWVKNVINEIND